MLSYNLPMNLLEEKKRCYSPFTCWGEYGSELESGGDSGRVLENTEDSRCDTQ